MTTVENRCRLARERAGLSIGQASKLLNVDRGTLEAIEAAGPNPAAEGLIKRMTEIYQVRVEWMLGEVDRYDYSRVDRMKGADRLTPRDRDIIAEFAASMRRRKT